MSQQDYAFSLFQEECGEAMQSIELRRMLEMAAKAQEIAGQAVGRRLFVSDSGNVYDWLYDDGDSARMRSALGICTNWIWYVMNGEHKCVGVECTSPFSRAIDVYLKDHNGDRNAALRLCALKVAAMIGEGME